MMDIIFYPVHSLLMITGFMMAWFGGVEND